MRAPPASQLPPKVILDYVSPHGPTVTHMRGLMLVNSQENLRSWGVYERYLALLDAPSRSILTGTIATSWIEAEIAMKHYAVVDQLGVSDRDAQLAGEALAARIAETFYSTARGAAERLGIEPFTFVLSHNHKTWERMYQGGGCTVVQYGPQELLLEDHGNPLVESHLYRVGYAAYMKALASLFCRASWTKQEQSRGSERHRLATRFSWR